MDPAAVEGVGARRPDHRAGAHRAGIPDDEWCAWAPGPMRADGGDGRGQEPLVAAMRAYVAGKLGESIDLESLLAGVSRPAS